MTEKTARWITERIINDYKPYTPNRGYARVLAHFIPNAIDTDEALCAEGTKYLYFELVTEQQIHDESSFDDCEVDFNYSFVAKVCPDDPAYKNASGKFAEESYCWVSLISERDDTNKAHSIKGYANISYSVPFELRDKYFLEEALPTTTSAFLSWNDDTTISDIKLRNKHLDYVSNLDNRFREISSEIDNNQKSGHGDSGNGTGSDSGNTGCFDSGNIQDGNDGSSRDGNSLNGSGSAKPGSVKIHIYRVGLANTIYLKYSNGKTILLDCGLDIDNAMNYKDTRIKILTR